MRVSNSNRKRYCWVDFSSYSSMLLHLKNCLFIHLALHPSMYVPWQSSRKPSRSAVMWKTKLLSTSYSQMLECSWVKVTLRADEVPCVSALLRGDALTGNMWTSQDSPLNPPIALILTLTHKHTYSSSSVYQTPHLETRQK